MSSPVIQTEQTVNTDKATKVSTRQPTLPDKYGKFIQFAYYMMENVLGDDFQIDKAAFMEKIALFGTVGEQQTLIQGFLNGTKDTKKNIKTLISDRKKADAKANKPPKQSRAKKVAATTTDANGEEIVVTANKPPKQSRAKKGVQADNAQLLDDLVEITQAQAAEQVENVPVVTEKKPTKKATAANKPVTNPAVVDEPSIITITDELVPETFVVTEETEQPVNVTTRKPKVKKALKLVEAPSTPILDDIVIPGTDIEVSIIIIDGNFYFMDDVSNIYSHPIPSANSLGTYNPLTRQITYK